MCERFEEKLKAIAERIPVVEGGADAKASMAREERQGLMGKATAVSEEGATEMRCSVVMAKEKNGEYSVSLFAKSKGLAAMLELRAALQAEVEAFNNQYAIHGYAYGTDAKDEVVDVRPMGKTMGEA